MTEENQQPKPLTPEEQKDLEKRVKAFNGEMIPLLEKYKLGLGSTAGLTKDGRIHSQPIIFDDSKENQKVDESGGKGNLETAE